MVLPRHPVAPAPGSLPADAPEADVEEQRLSVGEPSIDLLAVAVELGDPEVPEADALEQALDVPLDEDAERR